MVLKIKELASKHFKENFFLYFIMILCLMIGISAGAITIKVLDSGQKKELVYFLNSFFQILSEDDINNFQLLRYSIGNNIQTVVLIWLFGALVIGIPLVFGIVILRGFVMGFTVGFLLSELGGKGFLLSILSVIPQNILIIPAILIISVISVKFALRIIRTKIRKTYRNNYLKGLLQFSLIVFMVTSLIFIGGFIEAYITPIFMKLIVGILS